MGVDFISEQIPRKEGKHKYHSFRQEDELYLGGEHMLNTSSVLSSAPHVSAVVTASSSTWPACVAFCVSCVFSCERLNLVPLIQNGIFNLKCLREFNMFYPCQINIKITRKSRLEDCVYLNITAKSASKKCSYAESKHGSPTPVPSLWGLQDNVQNIQQIGPGILPGFFNVL